MKRAKILVIGSLNMDWMIEVSHTPIAGETIMGHFNKEVPGGKGGNQAYAIGSLGGHVTMLGAVGNDAAGKTLLETLQHAGVNTSAIELKADVQSGMALIYINGDGDNTIVVLPNANHTITKECIWRQKELIEEADMIVLQMEIPHEAVYEAIHIAHSLGKIIILNPAPAPSSIPNDILSKIDYLTPNETELELLSGYSIHTLEETEQAAKSLLEKGVKHVITTLGSKGALLVNTQRTTHFPGYPAHVVDTTAAGDSFNGAIAVYLSEGKTIDEAIQFANRVASITVTRPGAQSSIPFRTEL